MHVYLTKNPGSQSLCKCHYVDQLEWFCQIFSKIILSKEYSFWICHPTAKFRTVSKEISVKMFCSIITIEAFRFVNDYRISKRCYRQVLSDSNDQSSEGVCYVLFQIESANVRALGANQQQHLSIWYLLMLFSLDCVWSAGLNEVLELVLAVSGSSMQTVTSGIQQNTTITSSKAKLSVTIQYLRFQLVL